jgi:hypothetical protein
MIITFISFHNYGIQASPETDRQRDTQTARYTDSPTERLTAIEYAKERLDEAMTVEPMALICTPTSAESKTLTSYDALLPLPDTNPIVGTTDLWSLDQ